MWCFTVKWCDNAFAESAGKHNRTQRSTEFVVMMCSKALAIFLFVLVWPYGKLNKDNVVRLNDKVLIYTYNTQRN